MSDHVSTLESPLQAKTKEMGLWMLDVPEEYGGAGIYGRWRTRGGPGPERDEWRVPRAQESALLGRVVTPTDEDPDALGIVLLSYGYWRSHFGEDREIVGKTLQVDGATREIVGVLPPSVRALGQDPAIVVPLQFRRAGLFVGNMGFSGIARLKAGVTIEQAEADMRRMLPLAVEKFPAGPAIEFGRQAGFVPSATPLNAKSIMPRGEGSQAMPTCVARPHGIAATSVSSVLALTWHALTSGQLCVLARMFRVWTDEDRKDGIAPRRHIECGIEQGGHGLPPLRGFQGTFEQAAHRF